MALDPYASCPCGSGKKFKWCCQPIQVEIDRALYQQDQGQHELALRLIDEVVAAHPDNPVVYGRKAQILYQNGQVEQAEEALQLAFARQPNYPFGYLLKGVFRYQEGEVPGALLLFRKAADAYDPQAVDLIAQVHEYIADCEFKLNRPVAARAALQMTLRARPNDQELRQNIANLFGDDGRLPLAARKEYAFRAPAPASNDGVRLSDAVRLLDDQTKATPDSAAAWFNLGVARAWVGDNAAALEALDRSVTLETDDGRAAEAWALGEALRLGVGMDAQCDHHDIVQIYELRDGRPVSACLQEWEAAGRFHVLHNDPQQNLLQGIVLDAPPTMAISGRLPDAVPLGANFLVAGNVVRLSGVVRDRFDRVRAEFEQKAAGGMAPARERLMPPNFGDVLTEAAGFPVNPPDEEGARARIRGFAEAFFEGTWLHRPLKSLAGTPPVDAAGHAVLKKKLRGVVQFLEESSAAQKDRLGGYDFGRLRRKLGLEAATAAAPGEVPADIDALATPGLLTLPVDQLTNAQLEQAWRAALRLDAHEIGRRFATALTTRPGLVDVSPWYLYLVQRSSADKDYDAALGYVDAGEKADCERNEGRRRNEFELRRGQVHARRGEADAAHDVFDRLVQRDPDNLGARAAAAEAMLALKQGPRALRFAEEGLAVARKKNDRDSEGHLMELAAAARRASG